MTLTEQLALKYARYRLRFLEGAAGTYQGPQLGVYNQESGQFLVEVVVPGLPTRQVPSLARGARVPFLRNATRPRDEPGAFVIAEKLAVDPATLAEPGNLDTAAIKQVKHGDNTLHASWAFVAFVAEYVITHDLATLRLADNILRSFQRLGDYSPGHGEDPDRADRPMGEFWGYLLRSDVVDDIGGDAGDAKERIQGWLNDPDAKSPLEPSPDQYTSLFCGALTALRILSEAQANDPAFPTSEDHARLLGELRGRLEERVRSCHRYVARHCRYFLKHPSGRMVKRGGWCWQFAFEFADVVSTVLGEDFDDHFEPFALTMLPDIFSAFIPGAPDVFADRNADHLADLILDGVENVILGTTVARVRDAIFSAMTTRIPILDEVVDLLSFLDQHSELQTDVDGFIRDALRNWVRATIRPTLRELLRAALDASELLDRPGSQALSRLLFKISADLFFATNLPALQVGGQLVTTIPASFFAEIGLFDPAALDSLIDITIDIPVSTNGFTVTILGIERTIGELNWGNFRLTTADLPRLDWAAILGDFPVPVAFNAAEAIYRAADYLGFDDTWIAQKLLEVVDLNPLRGDFFPFGYFTLMATNDSFGRYLFNGDVLAVAFESGFFAALDYRLNRRTAALPVLRDQAAIAPEGYPNGRTETIWDEDFLWLRDRQPGDDPSDHLYSGLDFLSAVAIAASANPAGNRGALRAAIEKVLEENSKIDVPERDGVFNLPFRGPIAGPVPAFVLSRDHIGLATHLNLSVVFQTPGAPGRVLIRVADAGSVSDLIEFRQDHPGKIVVVPVPETGISIESADAGVTAVLVVALP